MVIIFFSGNLHKAREISQILRNCEVRLYSEFVDKFSIEESGETFAQNAKIKLLGLKARLEECAFDSAKFGGRRVILMAEDSGICVELLDNFPHIFSARFANLPPLPLRNSPSLAEGARGWVDSTDSENVARLISELKAKNLSESNAQFISCIACCEIENFKDSTSDSRGSILEIKSGFCETSNDDKTKVYRGSELKQSPILARKTNARILTAHGFLSGKVITQIKGTNGFGYDPIFVPNGFSQTLGELDTEAKNALSHRASALKLMALLLQ